MLLEIYHTKWSKKRIETQYLKKITKAEYRKIDTQNVWVVFVEYWKSSWQKLLADKERHSVLYATNLKRVIK